MAGLDDSFHLHGEHQTVEGKFIVVDAITRRGIPCAVQISGDFTVKSAATLNAINSALLAAPMNADREQIADAVRGALGDSTGLRDVSPEDLATAMWRALQQAPAA